MTFSKPPVIRAVISKETPEKLVTRVVTLGEIGDWVKLGWRFVCADPADEEKVARWHEKSGHV